MGMRIHIRTRMMDEDAALSGLLQLSSAALPIGAFSHSLGIEAAVDARLVVDAGTAERWIGDQLMLLWARGDAVLWLRLYAAWASNDWPAITEANDQSLAMRESQEMLLECTQTGHSLRAWLLGIAPQTLLRSCQAEHLRGLQPLSFGCAHALAAQSFALSARQGLHALGWSLLENLCAAALKLIPLGQTQGQAMLRSLALKLPLAMRIAQSGEVDEPNNFSPMLAILSARHESQYSRLFRS